MPKIFLDLDDVLNDFTLPTLRDLGCPIEADEWEKYPAHLGFDMVGAANELCGESRFTPQSLWRSVTREMWANRPVSRAAGDLIDLAAKLVGQENVAILTSPTRDADCAAGKMEWVQNFCPYWMQRQTLIGACKYMCASPDAILIDDADHNIDAWQQHGGIGVLWAKPWNRRRGEYPPWSWMQDEIRDAVLRVRQGVATCASR